MHELLFLPYYIYNPSSSSHINIFVYPAISLSNLHFFLLRTILHCYNNSRYHSIWMCISCKYTTTWCFYNISFFLNIIYSAFILDQPPPQYLQNCTDSHRMPTFKLIRIREKLQNIYHAYLVLPDPLSS
jgi:hypothetical protein